MKFKMFIPYVLFINLLSGCGGGSTGETTTDSTTENNDATGNAAGVIKLSGDDTAVVGTQLEVGDIGVSLASGLLPDYITIVGKNSSVTFTPPNILTPDITDPNNGFVMVVMNDSAGSVTKGISMSIIVNGEKLDYACSTPVTTFIECGTESINLDIENKTVIFDNTKVINTSTNTVLSINGTLTWTENNVGSTDNSNGSVNGPLTDIAGVWQQDDGYFWTSDRGAADEVYDIYRQDGTYITFAYYIGEGCYDNSAGDYTDLGDGNISIDGDDPYYFILNGNTMTVSYLNESYTSQRSSLTESDFTPICN